MLCFVILSTYDLYYILLSVASNKIDPNTFLCMSHAFYIHVKEIGNQRLHPWFGKIVIIFQKVSEAAAISEPLCSLLRNSSNIIGIMHCIMGINLVIIEEVAETGIQADACHVKI